jgi:hypothetical protein
VASWEVCAALSARSRAYASHPGFLSVRDEDITYPLIRHRLSLQQQIQRDRRPFNPDVNTTNRLCASVVDVGPGQ